MTYNPINQNKIFYDKQIATQDENLAKLEKGLDNLHTHAKTIGQELKSQNKMLNELNVDIDQSNDQMSVTNHKLGKLLKSLKSASCCNQYAWIGILFSVLIMLVILTIFL